MSAPRKITHNGQENIVEVEVDLRRDGLLWLINRVAFHPRGFALAMNPTTREFTLWGNGDEPWRYDPPVDENALFETVENLFKFIRAAAAHEESLDEG